MDFSFWPLPHVGLLGRGGSVGFCSTMWHQHLGALTGDLVASGLWFSGSTSVSQFPDLYLGRQRFAPLCTPQAIKLQPYHHVKTFLLLGSISQRPKGGVNLAPGALGCGFPPLGLSQTHPHERPRPGSSSGAAPLASAAGCLCSRVRGWEKQ